MARIFFRFTLMIYLLSVVQETHLEMRSCIKNEDHITKMISCLFLGVMLSLILYNFTKYCNLPFPYRVVVLTFGGIFGIISKLNPVFDKEIENNILKKPKLLLMVIVPVLIYRNAFNLDIHTFVRSWVQIFILAVPGFILCSCFTGFLMMLLMPGFTFATAILFGCVCTSIYPIEIINLLNEVGQFKPLTVLLAGESVIGDGSMLIIFTLAFGVSKEVLITWYHVTLVFLRFSIGGILLGYIFGAILVFLLRTLHNNIVNMTIMPLASSFITYFVAAECVDVSPIIAVVVLGIKTGMEKNSMSTDIENFLTNFWDLIVNCIDTIMCIIAGMLVVKLFSVENMFRDNALVLVTYIVSTAGRLFSYILVTPLVSRFGYGLTFKEMVIAVWSGLKGPVPLLLGILADHPSMNLGRDVLFHISALTVLTLLINASTMPYVLKLLGVSEVSVIRKINMNNCMRNLRNRRDRTIATLKMDRFLSDANWSVVNEATEIKHPYQINYSDSDDESDILFYNRSIICPDCKKEIAYEPTKKEMADMLREARMRILKAKKMSYTRQYQSGMLSKDGIRVLLQGAEMAMDTPDGLIQLDSLRRYFKRQGFMHYARRKLFVQFFKKSDCPVKPPRRYWRKVCYNIVTNDIFKLLLHFCIIIDFILTWFELLSPPDYGTDFYAVIIIFNIIFFLIFFMEFVLKIIGFSWVYICKHGFRAYFTSYWNIFDFACLLVIMVDVIFISIDLLNPEFQRYECATYETVLIAKQCRIIRLIRILTLCNGLYPILILYCDSKIDEHSAFAYDIGKGVVTGEEEVASMLPLIIDNVIIRDHCRAFIEADRLTITKDLGIIQKDKPWIAITVKTRQAARSTLNSMQDAVQKLKLSGGVDDFEYMKLMDSIEESFKHIRSKLKSVQPCSPKEMFKEVPWMTGNDEVCNFLYNNVVTKVFDEGDTVCVDGQLSDNIYVLVIGIFKLTYIPKANIIDRLVEYGALPVVDYTSSPRFEERIQDYILSGNCIGELSVLANRPYDCTIIAESASQAYVISKDILKEAFLLNPNIVNGLEARMWKAISIRLATTILMETPAYQSSTQEQIKYCLERAFVPMLTNYKLFYVNELIEDVILLEGVVWDGNTKERYTAPCYIPRTVQKILFPRNMNFKTVVETKLLFIPTKDVIDFDIVDKSQDASEMISNTSSRCLQHSVKNQMVRKKRKMGPHEYYRRSRLSSTKSGKSQSYDSYSKSGNSYMDEVELQSHGQNLSMNDRRDNTNSSRFKNFEPCHNVDGSTFSSENWKHTASKERSAYRNRVMTKSFMSQLLNNVESGTCLNTESSLSNTRKFSQETFTKPLDTKVEVEQNKTQSESEDSFKDDTRNTSSYCDSEKEILAVDLTNVENPSNVPKDDKKAAK